MPRHHCTIRGPAHSASQDAEAGCSCGTHLDRQVQQADDADDGLVHIPLQGLGIRVGKAPLEESPRRTLAEPAFKGSDQHGCGTRLRMFDSCEVLEG